MKSFSRSLATLLALSFAFHSAAQSVPSWDARGANLLPAQGIACLHVGDDGSFAVGTFAAAGDPNVFLFDAKGQLVRSHVVGQRAIAQVAIGGAGQLHALCTMPDGRAGDGPTVFAVGETSIAIPSNLGEAGYPRTIFHYGAHSNHTGVQLAATNDANVVLYGNQLQWLGDKGKPAVSTANLPWSSDAVATAVAADPSGTVVAGFSAHRTDVNADANLFLIAPGEKKPRWQRPGEVEVGKSERPEKGIYGTPTLRDGSQQELPQRELPVVAPLSLAVNRGKQLTRIAAADYPGFQRWIRSSATGRDQNYGTRFMPAAPTITVYGQEGQLIRRFGPERFPQSGWFDLAFLPGERWLLVYPHHWTSRGLAGQPRLPADDEAKIAWLLDINTGDMNALQFENAIADVAVNDAGTVAIACWDGRIFLEKPHQKLADSSVAKLPAGQSSTGPALVRSLPGDAGWVVARANGLVQVLNAKGELLRETNLSDGSQSRSATQPWVVNAKAEKINEGLWQLPGGRVESDLGGQRVIEGKDGLILIEGHAGLSFAREWQAMKAAGLDPTQVKYVLTTHEHGDHSPGAYLWRVTTGAKFICSEEMAYTLQHHIPQSTGYGLHPPVPVDIRIRADEELDLCGVKVRAVRLPGHTAGSMGWLVERGGKKYVAIGDLIMPDGVLGYSGSINFSGSDVLASLRKLESLQVDFILPGHGPITSPERYVAAGIDVGRHVGWGKVRPEAPDPRFRLNQTNVIVAAWNLDQTSADFGDVNGDGWPDIAAVSPHLDGAVVKIFLNQTGKFSEQPSHEIAIAEVAEPNKLRVRELNGDGRLDFFIGGRRSALLLSAAAFPNFEKTLLSLGDDNLARRVEWQTAGQFDIVANARFGAFTRVGPKQGTTARNEELQPRIVGPYVDVWTGDINGDGRSDLVYSYGQIFLRDSTGKLPAKPSLQLPAAKDRDWSYFAVGDFNADKRIDLAYFTMPSELPEARVFYNTGEAALPFKPEPNEKFDLTDPPGEKKNQKPYLRDSVLVADWNRDGVDDLIIGKGQDNAVWIILGSKEGLRLNQREKITLDYRLHYETGLFVGDFNRDGKPDLAALGYTNTGVGSGGPLAVYIYVQP